MDGMEREMNGYEWEGKGREGMDRDPSYVPSPMICVTNDGSSFDVIRERKGEGR